MLGHSRGAGGVGGDTRYLLRSILFLAVLGALAYLSRGPLMEGFRANMPLNGTILGILAFGILYACKALLDVLLVSREAGRATSLVEEAQRGNRPLEHVNEILLGPSMRGLGEFLRTVHRILSKGETSATLPYLLDSAASRGEDRRALVRYLTSALVLLGLIGTFYGLLITIGGVRDVLGNLEAGSDSDTMALLAGLKERLALPLEGMGVAFSSSLFGLLASLVLAFLELQLFHAQNDLHARLEGLVVGDLVPLWERQSARPAGAPGHGRIRQLRQCAAGHHGGTPGSDRRICWNLSWSARTEAPESACRLPDLNEHLDSLRQTLDILERERTSELRNELRLLSRSPDPRRSAQCVGDLSPIRRSTSGRRSPTYWAGWSSSSCSW